MLTFIPDLRQWLSADITTIHDELLTLRHQTNLYNPV